MRQERCQTVQLVDRTQTGRHLSRPDRPTILESQPVVEQGLFEKGRREAPLAFAYEVHEPAQIG